VHQLLTVLAEANLPDSGDGAEAVGGGWTDGRDFTQRPVAEDDERSHSARGGRIAPPGAQLLEQLAIDSQPFIDPVADDGVARRLH
jgi:hypothetical protein